DLPTSHISTDLNTQDTAHTYVVELYSDGELAATSNKASSLFLELTPNDNQIEISWQENTPWLNYKYDIYRQTAGEGVFELIDSTTSIGYIDSNLVNNVAYCYYIVSYGSYFSELENDTLVNFSQQTCSQPFDRTPPCPPELAGDGDCVFFEVDLNWSDPILECPETDDVVQYNIYFAAGENEEFELIETIDQSQVFDFQLIFENSIAGCYAITALDSLSLRPNGDLIRNESELSNIICFDNCPIYELPNVFTPNGDGRNDVFRPFPYRSIISVDFTVFNRWGNIVFQSTDPDILWDGTNSETGELVSDGTYYYTCKVNSIRLDGIDPISLSGYISVFGDRGNNPSD
ncbi:MAG: T9SS type B sorting domain-containing protein, partial [Bacteroidetes bacterium]|nr:T9SS type B sorting domain-containing protein [Bacteroidota bacterium]